MKNQEKISFMGDTQIGGDKEQVDRMNKTKELVEQYPEEIDIAGHVGDLGTSETAYEFLARYNELGQAALEKKDDISFEEELQQALDKAFNEVVERGEEKATKYVMGKALRKRKEYPGVEVVLREFAQKVLNDHENLEQYEKFIVGQGDQAKLDMFKTVTGRNEDFFELDEKAMITEMNEALDTMATLAGKKGKLIVVPGNQEKANWQRVTEKVLPEFQRDVDLQEEPSYHEVNDNVAIMGVPYEFDTKEFNAKEFAGQAEGKKSVILAMHASPLLRGLAENIDLENYKGTESYEKMKLWLEERKKREEKFGKGKRTPGSQLNPVNRQFREIVRDLPQSVKTIIVPWGHLHSAPEQALANHPWYTFEEGEEIKPQKLRIGMPGKMREIEFVYLPTAAVAIFSCKEDGSIDVESLKKIVSE